MNFFHDTRGHIQVVLSRNHLVIFEEQGAISINSEERWPSPFEIALDVLDLRVSFPYMLDEVLEVWFNN